MSTQPDQNALDGLHTARTQRYTEAMIGTALDDEGNRRMPTVWERAERAMAVADAEQAKLRAEVERVWCYFETDAAALRKRAVAAESDLAHTRRILERRTEALNRVITERDTLRAQLAAIQNGEPT